MIEIENNSTLFWGFMTPDREAAVQKIRETRTNTIWIGCSEQCDLQIDDFYEYDLARIPKIDRGHTQKIELNADEKNRIYCVLQREPIGWQCSHIELSQLTHFFVNWYSDFLLSNKVDRVWFAYIPHLGSELILYYVAKALSIPTSMFYQSLFKNKAFLIDDIDEFGKIPPDMGAYSEFSESIKFGTPEQDLFYMRKIPPVQSNTLWLSKKIIYRIRSFCKGKFGQIGIVSLARMYAARAKWLRWLRSEKWDHVHAENLNYVYFPLHLQPELTTDPLGGDFYGDQAFSLEMLREKLPADVAIVVKENPKQSFEWRDPYFFERIRRLPNVFFVSATVNTYYLLKHAKAVSTISGTAGWEAVLGGKPTIIFGAAWYRDLYGVFDGKKDALDWQAILDFKPNFTLVAQQMKQLASHLPEVIADIDYVPIYPEYNSAENQQALINILTSG